MHRCHAVELGGCSFSRCTHFNSIVIFDSSLGLEIGEKNAYMEKRLVVNIYISTNNNNSNKNNQNLFYFIMVIVIINYHLLILLDDVETIITK